MPYAVRQKVWGIDREQTRGTAEAAPSRFIPVGVGSEMTYAQQYAETEKSWSNRTKLRPIATVKEGTGKIEEVDAEADLIGEMLLGVLGDVSSAQQGGSSAYKHTITPLATIQLPSYTVFVDRGEDIRQYTMTTMKKVTIKGEVDQPLRISADVLFKAEADGPASLSPSWVTPDPLVASDVAFKVAGSQDSNVRNWELSLDNQVVAKRAANGSMDVADICAPGILIVSGKYTVWFESDAERDKFLGGTSTSIQMVATGTLIADTYYKTLDILCPEVYYKGFPFTDVDGILCADVDFEAYYNIDTSKCVQADLTNSVTSYAAA